MARNPLQYTWLVLLLVMVTGAAILSTTVGGTLERSQRDQVQYEIGADLRISNFASYWMGGTRMLKETYLNLPGVTSLALAFRDVAVIDGTYAQILAIESREFPYLSWYREDFSERSLDGVMGQLQSYVHVERLRIPEKARSIGVWVMPKDEYPKTSMWMTIRDQNGSMQNLYLGNLGTAEWQLMTAQIPSKLKFPAWLVSVQIYEGGLSMKTPGELMLDDIHVTLDPLGERYLLDNFEGELEWIPIITSRLYLDRMVLVRDLIGEGKLGLFSFGPESRGDFRGFYQSPTEGPIPVVVSTTFTVANGVQVGDHIIGEVRGRKLPMIILDTVDYFPTINPDGGGFILADLEILLDHMNVIGSLGLVSPNEVFMSEGQTNHQTAREAVLTLVRNTGEVHHMATELDSIRLNALATAGWRAMVLPSLIILILTAGFGYSVHLLSVTGRYKREIGFLKSMGLSRLQLAGMRSFEQLTVVAIGLGLGSWFGFQMSRLVVSPLAVTERGDRVVPPFIIMTDWTLMVLTYGALVGIIMVALFVLMRNIDDLDLHSSFKMEDR